MPDALRNPLSTTDVSAWLADPTGIELFGSALLDIAQSIAGIDELFAYIVESNQEPEILISRSRLSGVDDRVSAYVRRFFRHDPAMRAIKRMPSGESFVQRVSLTDIIPYDYRQQCFTQPGFSEKLTFGWRGESYLFVVSFYSQDAQQPDAPGKLASLANLMLAAMVRQHSRMHMADASAVLERRLQRAFPALSPREREVCALTIVGFTAARIAERLGLSMGTVLTFRQRSYQKTGVSSAAQLLPFLLN